MLGLVGLNWANPAAQRPPIDTTVIQSNAEYLEPSEEVLPENTAMTQDEAYEMKPDKRSNAEVVNHILRDFFDLETLRRAG